MKLIQRLKILVVTLVLIVPALVFVASGSISGFEQKKQTEFPPVSAVFYPATEAREQLADAIFERSAAKRWSIQFMNALHLYGFGFIDTPRAISGIDHWLFYKPQFEAWDCDRHEVLQLKLQRFQFLVDLVSAADIPLIFVHAPNKASIEREYLGGRTTRYHDCYFRFEKLFNDAISVMPASHFVDHSTVLRHAPGAQPTYLKYDTHWTRANGVKAMNQLFESRPGRLGLPLYQPQFRNEPEKASTLSKILLLESTDQISVPVSVKPGSGESQEARLVSNVLFFHDSFYDRILRYLKDRSPNARFLLSGSDIGVSAGASLRQADIVVVEMVQRHFLDSIWSSKRLGWGGVFAEWLLEEMASSTQGCNWAKATVVVPQPLERQTMAQKAVTKSPNEESADHPLMFQLPRDLIAAKLCLRVKISLAGKGKAKLYFSATDASATQPEYSQARMIQKNLSNGVNTLALVLPESVTSKWVKLEFSDHGGEVTIQSLEVAPAN